MITDGHILHHNRRVSYTKKLSAYHTRSKRVIEPTRHSSIRDAAFQMKTKSWCCRTSTDPKYYNLTVRVVVSSTTNVGNCTSLFQTFDTSSVLRSSLNLENEVCPERHHKRIHSIVLSYFLCVCPTHLSSNNYFNCALLTPRCITLDMLIIIETEQNADCRSAPV